MLRRAANRAFVRSGPTENSRDRWWRACCRFVARALLLPILPVPRPAIQDEFSYLLASDTFASGRLANPTPALAEHFETLQELIRPVYASKYPPLSGLVMAAAQKLTGQPWVGVWLSMGVLCARAVLGAAGLAAGGVGAGGKLDRGAAYRHRELLDRELLGRHVRGHRRRAVDRRATRD